MNWKTARKRRKRQFWNRRGHTHLVFNRGNYTRPEIDPDGMSFHVPFEREQPRAYVKYP